MLLKAGGLYAGSRGFTLVEMLIAMAVGLVVLGAMYSTFTIQNKTFANQEEIVTMQQSVRAGMDMMAREIGMAGYDPLRVYPYPPPDNCPSTNFSCQVVSGSQLQIKADLRGANPNDPPDGSITNNSEENIIYKFDSANKRITRDSGSGDQPFVENVDNFTFKYFKSDGITEVTLPAESGQVRVIRITITGRTAKPDPSYSANGGYRTYTLTSVIAPRNLAF